jgi:single-strand DNA-binding protein
MVRRTETRKKERPMAGSVNKVILIGNLGANPELKYLPSGQAVCEMRLATNDVWTDKQGQRQERTEWHRVKVWGKVAENCAKYLAKGRTVYVEGRLQTRSWDDQKTGEKRYATDIVADRVQFLGGGPGGEAGPRAYAPTGAPAAGGAAPASAGEPPPDFGGPGPGDDDIPF